MRHHTGARIVCIIALAMTGVARDTRMDDRSHLRLFLAGDVMTGRGVDQILPHPSDPQLHEDYVRDARDYVRLAERVSGPIARPVDYDYVWGDALAKLKAYRPDLRLINLETSVTTSPYFWQWKGIHYRMHPDNVRCLAAARPNCCMLANNHVLDWGYSGLMETLTTLYRAGLSFAGAGSNSEEAARPARLVASAKARVLVYAFAEGGSGVPGSWAATIDRAGINRLRDLDDRTATRIARRIATERRDGDIVVISIHWGGNWGYDVPPAQRQFAHRLIDSGAADLVYGHSSHHARAIECYEGRLIIYGTGDFITDYEGIRGHEHYRPWLSPMYFVDLDPATGALERLQIVPLRLQRFRLAVADTEEHSWLLEQLNRASRDLETVLEPGNGALVLDACATA